MNNFFKKFYYIIKTIVISAIGFVMYLFLTKKDKIRVKQKLGEIKAKKVPPKKTRYSNQSLDDTIERMR